MDDVLVKYEQAIIVSFDVVHNHSKTPEQVALGNEASRFLQSLEANPNRWMLALDLLRLTNQSVVKFFCLQSIQVLLNTADDKIQLSQESRSQLRVVFMNWIREAVSTLQYEEKYIRFKVGVVLALLVRAQFPTSWPTAFDELLSLLSHQQQPLNSSAAELFVLTLAALDEEVVCLGGAEAMAIKDAMRVSVIARLIPALGEICFVFAESNVDVVKRCWGVIGLYTSWVDIGLTTEEQFLRVWFRHCMDERFQLDAVSALERLLHKGMDSMAKLNLIVQLGLSDACVDFSCEAPPPFTPKQSFWTVVKSQHPNPRFSSSDEFQKEAAKFCASLGLELLECRKLGALPQIVHLRNQVRFCLFSFLSRVDKFDIHEEVLELANQLVMCNTPKSVETSGLIDFFEPDMVAPMFLAVFASVQLLQDTAFDDLEQEGGNEDEDDFLEHRSNVKRLFLNLVRCSGAKSVLPLLHHLVSTSFTPNSSPNQIEAILYLVHAFGEGAPELSNKKVSNELTESFDHLLVSLFQSLGVNNPARVAVMFNELIARYINNLRSHACLPTVLSHVCGAGGIHHSHALVRSRATAVLLRVIRSLEQFCGPFYSSILSSLHDVITTGLQFHVCTESHSPSILAIPDVMQIFEACGMMLGNIQWWPEPSLRSGFLQPIVLGTLISSLEQAIQAIGPNSNKTVDELTHWGACQLEALAAICKGFSLQTEEELVSLWRNVLRSSLVATVALINAGASHEDEYLLTNLRKLCHALIRTIGTEILVFFPDICQCLLEAPQADVCRALPLLNQMMSAFRMKMFDSLSQSLLPILRATNRRIAPIANLPHPTQHDREELISMEKELFTFLFTIATNELSGVLYHGTNVDRLEEVLKMIVDGLSSVPDAVVQKSCCATLIALVKEWLSPASSFPLKQAFFQFAFENITPASFQATAQSHFNPKDAACSQLLLQICTLHLLLCDVCGAKWIEYLRLVYLPASCRQDVVQAYCDALKEGKAPPKELRSAFQRLFLGV